jgi:hypothetical protein
MYSHFTSDQTGLQAVQFGDDWDPEVGMAVDSYSFESVTIRLLLTFIIIFLICFLGFYGPSITEELTEVHQYTALTTKAHAIFILDSLSIRNRKVAFVCSFERFTDGPKAIEAELIINIRYFEGGHMYVAIPDSTQKIELNSQNSNGYFRFIEILNTECIGFDKISIEVSLTSENMQIQGIRGVWTFGNPFFRIFQVSLQSFFGLLSGLILIRYFMLLRAIEIKFWRIEQKFTSVLLIIFIIAHHPFLFVSLLILIPFEPVVNCIMSSIVFISL